MRVLIVLSLLFCAVFADHDSSSSSSSEETECDTELTRVHTEVRKCVNDDTFDFLKIHRNFKKLNDEVINEDEFKTFIDDFCPKALSGTRCGLEQIPTITEECQANDKVKVKKNMIRFYNTVFERLCKDDASGYKTLIKDHGVKCFMDNNDLNECWKSHGMSYMAKSNYKHENICKFVKVMTDCAEHLDKCDNHDVKTISTEVHTLLNEKLHCHEH